MTIGMGDFLQERMSTLFWKINFLSMSFFPTTAGAISSKSDDLVHLVRLVMCVHLIGRYPNLTSTSATTPLP
jgi:hypothetical protein